ncbi:MAG TPA: Gfo/Idh/MocA family oxidoreductase, partial [Mycobacterium sp.]|nr:Gfo/Idh/MocA family oxidoreductase [Mycobacterium sp.]
LVDVEVFVNARYGYDVRCELVCEQGTITLIPPAATVMRNDAAASGAVARDWRDRFTGAYRSELQDWVEGVVAGKARGASAWDGYVATAVAQAGVTALETGERALVRLAPKPGLDT